MCIEDYWKCEYYNPENPNESKCIKDSNFGYCTTEKQLDRIFKHWDEEIHKFTMELCQRKRISISEYLYDLVRKDLLDTGLLKIYEII